MSRSLSKELRYIQLSYTFYIIHVCGTKVLEYQGIGIGSCRSHLGCHKRLCWNLTVHWNKYTISNDWATLWTRPEYSEKTRLTHWGRVTHICVSKLTNIGSDNGLSPGRRQAIIWTNARILLIRTLGTNFSEILGEIHSFSFSKIHLKMSSAKWRLFGLGLNELLPWLPTSWTFASPCLQQP